MLPDPPYFRTPIDQIFVALCKFANLSEFCTFGVIAELLDCKCFFQRLKFWIFLRRQPQLRQRFVHSIQSFAPVSSSMTYLVLRTRFFSSFNIGSFQYHYQPNFFPAASPGSFPPGTIRGRTVPPPGVKLDTLGSAGRWGGERGSVADCRRAEYGPSYWSARCTSINGTQLCTSPRPAPP